MIIDSLNNTIKIGSFILSIETVTSWLASFGSKILRAIVIIILMTIILKLGNKGINKWIKNKENKGNTRSERLGIENFGLNEGMAKTIGAILKSILRYSVYFLGITAILSRFLAQ